MNFFITFEIMGIYFIANSILTTYTQEVVTFYPFGLIFIGILCYITGRFLNDTYKEKSQ